MFRSLAFFILISTVSCSYKRNCIDNMPHETVSYEQLPVLVKEVYKFEGLEVDTFREVCICIECDEVCVVDKPTIDKSAFKLLGRGFFYKFNVGTDVYHLKANKGSPFVFYGQFFYYPRELNLDSTNYKSVLFYRVKLPARSK